MVRNTTAVAIGVRRKPSLVAQQMDLFASRGAEDAPDWADLPKEAREALVGLMTQLIFEHAQARTPTAVETGHDR
jgi:hypothetical protein